MPRRKPEPSEADALRLELAEVITAAMRSEDEAERAALVKRRNAIGRQLAHLLKSRTDVLE